MKRVRSGYVLILAISLIGLMAILITRMAMRVMVFNRLTTIMLDREQAKLLAWSGVEIARATLLVEPPPAKEGENATVQRILFDIKKVMTTVNKWMPFVFTEEHDGVDGSCAIYLACEDGKLNANSFYDTEKKQLTKVPGLDIINQSMIKFLAPWGKDINVAQRVEAVIKSRKNVGIDDVTQLLTDETLKAMSYVLFMQPDRTFALSDLLSVDRSGALLQPWALSRSVADLFKLQPTGKMSAEDWKILEHALVYEPAGASVWEKVLRVVYGEKHPPIPTELYPLFNQKFEADHFSVISYGTYNKVVVKLYVVLQRQKVVSQEGKERDQFFVTKMYWI